MTQLSKPLRIAAGLLLASAAFPLTPALAQVTTTETPDEAQQPAQTTAPASQGVQASEPVVNTRPSGREPVDPDASEGTEAATRPAARRTVRSTAEPAARAERRAAAQRNAPQRRTVRADAPAASAPAPAPAPIPEPAPAPVAAEPAAPAAPPIEAPPAAAPAPEATTPAAAPEPVGQTASVWPWLLAAGLAIAGLLFLFRRRRRRADEADHVPYAAPAAAAAAAPVAAASGAGERPWIDIKMRPVRAGVGEDSARVQFQLDIQNTGSVHASDVRISTWMLPAGAEPTEVERMLIQRPAEAERRETELAPGEAARLETEVALPREGLHDAILPVVVADARYSLPDGSEGRTAASFAIGVPDGQELAMFDVENPSGLHDGVEARLHGTPKRD